ncbi:MAG: SPOR domain-containing protein [Treponema sp.]|nr:SPOR domain-containing protein [Treponema sp.]
MEQRKTLWIIAAVSIFLLVVLGFALIWSQTSTKTIQTSTSIIPVEKTNYSDGWTNNNNSTQSPAKTDETSSENSVTQVKDMFVVSENTTIFDLNQNETGTTIDLNALKNQQLYEKEETVQTVTPVENNNVVVKNESPASTTVAATPVKESAAKAEQTEKAASVKQPATTVSSPAKTTTTTTKPATTSTATTTKTTTTTTSTAKPAATTTEKAVTRYWVQVASYTNKKTAENARTILADNKINSDIYTYQDSSNTLYYRVRVGPYTTKSEAEYWMTKIAQISEFSKAGSYVTVTNN